jgi:serine/threonine protein kinase
MKDFEVVRCLGEGSMGVVHMVEFATGRGSASYALKVIDKGRVVREHQVERVMQEKKLLGLVSHPFVIGLMGTFQDDTRLFMLTEFAGEGDLFSAMQSSKFDDACAHFFAAQVTLALGHIHKLDIAYRDLKPENIVIDSLGHAKIIDFGLAKVVRTKTSTVCGTVEYMAPEVLSQIGHGRCVDWWALGILIFEMLAFQTPFTGRTATETRKNVCNRDPRCPPHFGSVTKRIVYLFLIKDQTLRLGSGANGIWRVQSHPWFSTVEWGDLLQRRCISPFLPGARGDGGAPARDRFLEREADGFAVGGLQEVDACAAGGLTEAQQELFRGF